MKVGDLVRYKDTIREDIGIITEIFPMGDNSVRFGSIFGRRVKDHTDNRPKVVRYMMLDHSP